jgi:hypothetical protein
MTAREYFDLQEQTETAYREKDYTSAKRSILAILNNLESIKKDMPEFNQINKPFVDYAIFIVHQSGVDDFEKEIIKKLLAEKIITKKRLFEYFEFSFRDISYAEQFYIFLAEIGIMTEEKAKKYIKQEKEGIEATKEWKKQQKILEAKILDYLADNPGFLQKDRGKLFAVFPDYDSIDIESTFSEMIYSGKIERQKAGRTYSLTVKR